MEDEHSSQAPPMNDDNNNDVINMNNNPYNILDYNMTTSTPFINNIPIFQYPTSSSSASPANLPQLPLTMPHHLVDSNNNISLESSNVDWVSLLSGFMNGDHQGSSMMMGREQGEIENINMIGKSMKSGKIRGKKVTPSRVAFHTRSTEDILDDGYKWRKYGQKSVKNSHHPRSYYRCTHHTCNVKKQIQRLSKDNSIVVTTYEGVHNHPCEKLMETLTPLLKQLQFLSRF